MSTQQLVTKSQYAEMRDRAPSAVSNWIRDGKLTAPALVGEGDDQMIDVVLADAQLARTLHPSHQASQSMPLSGSGKGADPESEHNVVFAKARADKAVLEAEQLRLKMEAESGRWVEVEAAKREHAAGVGDVLRKVDMWVGQAARAAALELSIDQGRLELFLEEHWRKFRQDRAAEESEQLAIAAE